MRMGSNYGWVLQVKFRVEPNLRQGDLYNLSAELDLPQEILPWFLFGKVEDNNSIGAACCSYLSQANIDGLEIIRLTIAEK